MQQTMTFMPDLERERQAKTTRRELSICFYYYELTADEHLHLCQAPENEYAYENKSI